jgi:hypothetical protein
MMTDEKAAELFRSLAAEAGLPLWMTPNDVIIALHDWFDSVPENRRDPLWREVNRLVEMGYDLPDVHERRYAACRRVLERQQLHQTN